ncbi:hypothetical protein [Kitasatospora cheerisanensis]|uniref:hypothetical protein n=1 Tax=Kitasatospora cheerisanensis TaxID=81942 RepID=UPI00068DF1C1|nr:hypothetical protein [Kitasatospora cheerisanensis]
MLAAIGLDEQAERVYTHLVAHGPATRAELAVRCGPVPVGSLELLQACGLVAPGAGRRYTAARPRSPWRRCSPGSGTPCGRPS